jgi:hypothetical protein
MLPHGYYSLVPAVLTTMAWMASLFQDKCDFSRVTGEIVAALADADDTPFLEVGFSAYREPIFDGNTGKWHVVYTGKCLEFPDGDDILDQDMSWNAAKICGFFASVLGGGGTFFLWFSTCCIFGRATWRLAGYEVLLAAIFQSFAFLWFNTDMCQDSDNSCSLFWGSRADILATSFWTLAALLIFCYYPVPKELDDENEGLVLDSREVTRPEVRRNDQLIGSPSHLVEPAVLRRTATAAPSPTRSGSRSGFAAAPTGENNFEFDESQMQEEEEESTTMSSGENSREERRSGNKDMADAEII